MLAVGKRWSGPVDRRGPPFRLAPRARSRSRLGDRSLHEEVLVHVHARDIWLVAEVDRDDLDPLLAIRTACDRSRPCAASAIAATSPSQLSWCSPLSGRRRSFRTCRLGLCWRIAERPFRRTFPTPLHPPRLPIHFNFHVDGFPGNRSSRPRPALGWQVPQASLEAPLSSRG